MSSEAPASSALPASIGIVGCGTIATAVVQGLIGAALAAGRAPPQFVVSPRSAAKATALASEFPAHVQVAENNQEVVDKTGCVLLAVLGGQAEGVISVLRFRPEQQILNLIAAVQLPRLRDLVAPATDCAVAVPLPAVAKRQGATVIMPKRAFAEAIFSSLGTCTAVEDPALYRRMQTLTAFMGDFYKRQLTAQQWLTSYGVPEEAAATFVGALWGTFSADSAKNAGPSTFEDLVAEQTPGGLNEMVWKDQEEDGAYAAMLESMEAAHHRLETGLVDPALRPAAKRAKR